MICISQYYKNNAQTFKIQIRSLKSLFAPPALPRSLVAIAASINVELSDLNRGNKNELTVASFATIVAIININAYSFIHYRRLNILLADYNISKM